MAPVIGPNFNAHAARKYSGQATTQSTGETLVLPEDITTVDGLKDWVGDDQAKARMVLGAEQAKSEDDQRSTLVSAMEAILAPVEGEDEGEDTPEGSEEEISGAESETGAEGEGEAESGSETAEEPVAVTIPEGTTKVKDLEAWAGDDQARAQAVLDAEAAKPEAERRKTLISKMESVVAGDGSDLI